MQSQGIRKSMSAKYPEKNPNYSPSTSYNYSPQTGFNANQQTQPRRRPEHFRKDAPSNTNERLIRQNDIIIKLLKEIRDRLPPCTVVPHDGVETAPVDAEEGTDAAVHEDGSKPEIAAIDVDTNEEETDAGQSGNY